MPNMEEYRKNGFVHVLIDAGAREKTIQSQIAMNDRCDQETLEPGQSYNYRGVNHTPISFTQRMDRRPLWVSFFKKGGMVAVALQRQGLADVALTVFKHDFTSYDL